MRAGTETFARARPESVEIEETFGFEQVISRNPSVKRGADPPTGRITVLLPYDGDTCFPRDALRDVERHLKRRDTPCDDVTALIGHLILMNYQDTNLPDVLNLTGRHGKVPLCLPVRSADLRDVGDLVSDHYEYYNRIDYLPATDQPKIIPIKLEIELTDPDHTDLPEIPRSRDKEALSSVAEKIIRYGGFQSMLKLRLRAHVTLPARQGPVLKSPQVRRISVKPKRVISLAPSSLHLEVDKKTQPVQHNPENRSLEWFDITTMQAREAGEDEPRSFRSPDMVMTISQPGELFTQRELSIEVEVEVSGELLSGMDARLFNALGRRYRLDSRNPLTIRSIITTRCTLVLRDAFARRQLSPYQSFHFDQIIPSDLRIADIATALNDQRFEVEAAPLTGAKSKGGLRYFLFATRREGPDTRELLVLVHGHRYTTQRRSEQSWGDRHTTMLDSGDLGIIVYGWVHRDTRDLVHEINELQVTLHDRFRQLKAPR